MKRLAINEPAFNVVVILYKRLFQDLFDQDIFDDFDGSTTEIKQTQSEC